MEALFLLLHQRNATGLWVQFGGLCRSNGTHCSSITVRWHRWTTEGEKALIDDWENGKREGGGERVLSLADVITRWQNRGEETRSGLPETDIMCYFFGLFLKGLVMPQCLCHANNARLNWNELTEAGKETEGRGWPRERARKREKWKAHYKQGSLFSYIAHFVSAVCFIYLKLVA